MHQMTYPEGLYIIPSDANFDIFPKCIMASGTCRARHYDLAWLILTHADLLTHVSIIAQVMQATFLLAHLKALNKGITEVKATSDRGLYQHLLDPSSLRITVDSHSSLENFMDQGTKFGYLILLTDDTERANCLQNASYICCRVVRLVLAGEKYAFVHSLDMAHVLQHYLEIMLRRTVSLTIIKNSESSFKMMVKSSKTTEGRVMIDIKVAREAYAKQEYTNVGWTQSENNPADGLKASKRRTLLEAILDSEKQHEHVENV